MVEEGERLRKERREIGERLEVERGRESRREKEMEI